MTREIVVIDYGAGNLRSVVRALTHVGGRPVATSDPAVVQAATAVVLPGVGATRDTMTSLEQLGLIDAIRGAITRGVPFLGICVGMQVLCTSSEEFGDHACLDIVPGRVQRFAAGLKVPQIGWNQVDRAVAAAGHPLFSDIPDGADFYFVHSYYCALTDQSMIAGTTEYGMRFPSMLLRERLAAVQFHPEKSGRHGLQLLANFVAWAAT